MSSGNLAKTWKSMEKPSGRSCPATLFWHRSTYLKNALRHRVTRPETLAHSTEFSVKLQQKDVCQAVLFQSDLSPPGVRFCSLLRSSKILLSSSCISLYNDQSPDSLSKATRHRTRHHQHPQQPPGETVFSFVSGASSLVNFYLSISKKTFN